MAACSAAEEVAIPLATETSGSDIEHGNAQRLAGRSFIAVATVAMVFAAVGSFVAMTDASPAKLQTSSASKKAFLGLSDDDGEHQPKAFYSYGLKLCPCPETTPKRSAEGIVNIAVVKTALGAKDSDTVKFWWVYPDGTDAEDNPVADPAIQQFKTWGGFQYSWGDETKCLGFLSFGNNFTLADSDFTPTVGEKDWHEVTIPSAHAHVVFTWIAPTNKKGECEAGCFAYKGEGDKITTLEVVTVEYTADEMGSHMK